MDTRSAEITRIGQCDREHLYINRNNKCHIIHDVYKGVIVIKVDAEGTTSDLTKHTGLDDNEEILAALYAYFDIQYERSLHISQDIPAWRNAILRHIKETGCIAQPSIQLTDNVQRTLLHAVCTYLKDPYELSANGTRQTMRESTRRDARNALRARLQNSLIIE